MTLNLARAARQALACPECHGELAFATDGAQCTGCGRSYDVIDDSYLAFVTEREKAPGEKPPGHGRRFMNDPLQPSLYLAASRAAFHAVMGSNWAGQLSEEDEERLVRDRLGQTEGLVLDLACGPGRWTKAAVDAVGPDRVVGLDLSLPMLAAARARLPGVPLVRATALSLPFADSSLGAVVCWNALQMFTEPARVIGQVGRCLRPGGTFVVQTFHEAADQIYRYFQRKLGSSFSKVTVFREDEIRAWLADAGMVVEDLGGPGTFMLVKARKVD